MGVRSPGVGNDNPLQYYSYLKNPVDRRAWWATVHGASKSDTAEHTHTTPTPLRQRPRSHTLQDQGPGIRQDGVKMSRVSDVTYLPIPQTQPLPLPS